MSRKKRLADALEGLFSNFADEELAVATGESSEPSQAAPSVELPAAAAPPAEAKEVAEESHPAVSSQSGEHLVVFTLANEHYGVDITAVESIIRMEPITVVPHAPLFVEGVINLRGSVLPVIDLRKRFELSAGETTKETHIVVVEMNSMAVGMVVDTVTEVLRVSGEDIEPPSAMVTMADSAFVTGIAKVGERLIILLDLDKLLSAQEQSDLQAFQQAEQ